MSESEICLVMRRFTVGGLERVVLLLANGLAARGLTVHVIVLEPAGLSAMITEMHPGVRIHILSGGAAQRRRRLRALTDGRTVHLHLHDKILPGVRWAVRDNPRVFVSYHSDYTPVRNRTVNRLDRMITGRSAGAIAVSKAVRDFCVNEVKLPAGHVTVIENAVPEPVPSAFRIAPDEAFTLVALATVNPHKNYPGLLRGLAAARRRGLDVRLRIIGDGPVIGEAFLAAAELGVSEAVDWFGGLWQTSVVGALLAGSDAFTSASRNEGLPMSVLEGLQYGLPMILSDIPPHREAAGEAAVYFPSEDPEKFADCVEELLEPDARKARAAEALQRNTEFRVADFLDRHVHLYSAVAPAVAEAAGGHEPSNQSSNQSSTQPTGSAG